VLLGALAALGPLTIDLYLPAFPVVADELRVSEVAIQLTLTATLAGYCIGQLIVGTLSDSIGRRTPLLIATSLHIVASLAVAAAPTVAVVTVGRFGQGIGAAGSAVIALAVVRDLYRGSDLVAALARVATVIMLAPVIAPLVASQILVVAPWRWLFVLLAGAGVALVTSAAILLPETRPQADPTLAGRSGIAQRYRMLWSDRGYVAVLGVSALHFGVLFTYLSASSFLFQRGYGFSVTEFGVTFAIAAVVLATAICASAWIARRVDGVTLIRGAQGVMVLGAGITIISHVAQLGPGVLIAGVIVTLTGYGVALPVIQSLALAPHTAAAGTAASLLGAGNFALGALAAPSVGLFGMTAASLGTVQLTLVALAVLAALRLRAFR
jgi:DHA1 family bicyclomycin/chloramphenicol resistance-like MFS transporter